MIEESAARRRGGGRPRDEGLRLRVLEIAVDVYAEHGWSGFNFETVSSAAGAGRPALYRRWADRSALLTDAILSTTPEVVDVDLGSLHDELLRILREYLQVLGGSRGRAGQRLYLDRDAIPDIVAAVHERLMGRRFQVVCAAMRRGADRAGRPAAIPDRLAFAFLLGGALMWGGGDDPRPAADAEAIVASVVALTGFTEP
ncbi:TetR/AcrR family transcriptional regulator [Frankia gtarii]|uniref:TetR/AcrR family transcriptional regulator n=1 Tax=Frankia gtarii TaxID=2950102 RepID=UPI0021BE6B45|nr:TetR/AcrR family transcriptional regulator [Frankia gtarii]